ncbi:hypothetical protein BS50DRAFT_626800 [Corynespora cassiicola Philippines]|uniref:AB hydrolase-1 domain-containing protein n=1 Tax=Corynespora cassiicola Philippines TaxID=1448308 RepID=A0A2T2N1I6_CORCC|nr:hypothetical protein BS50DRAFT_626800 [Corynespora cassiicola Philippines]
MGHSYGGLFTLYALFSGQGKGMFDTYIAASPSIWWDNGHVLCLAKSFASQRLTSDGRQNLFLSVVELEQHSMQLPQEKDEEYERRREFQNFTAMVERLEEVYDLAKKSGALCRLGKRIFAEKDHVSVAMCAVN